MKGNGKIPGRLVATVLKLEPLSLATLRGPQAPVGAQVQVVVVLDKEGTVVPLGVAGRLVEFLAEVQGSTRSRSRR